MVAWNSVIYRINVSIFHFLCCSNFQKGFILLIYIYNIFKITFNLWDLQRFLLGMSIYHLRQRWFHPQQNSSWRTEHDPNNKIWKNENSLCGRRFLYIWHLKIIFRICIYKSNWGLETFNNLLVEKNKFFYFLQRQFTITEYNVYVLLIIIIKYKCSVFFSNTPK